MPARGEFRVVALLTTGARTPVTTHLPSDAQTWVAAPLTAGSLIHTLNNPIPEAGLGELYQIAIAVWGNIPAKINSGVRIRS